MEQELRISQRAKQYPASGIRKMFDLAAQYPEAIKLTVGEPNFDTPQYIKDAAKRALDEGQTHYAPNAGTTELREAVAAKYRRPRHHHRGGHGGLVPGHDDAAGPGR